MSFPESRLLTQSVVFCASRQRRMDAMGRRGRRRGDGKPTDQLSRPNRMHITRPATTGHQ
jgi:hypothetical protein